MRIVREAELGRDPRLARLGPDILAPDMTADAAAAALRRAEARTPSSATRCSTRPSLAGIGNIFKSEGVLARRGSTPGAGSATWTTTSSPPPRAQRGT